MDDYDYSLDEYVSSDNDGRLREIEMAKVRREEQRLQMIAQMYLQDIIEAILWAGAQTEDAEEKFNKLIE